MLDVEECNKKSNLARGRDDLIIGDVGCHGAMSPALVVALCFALPSDPIGRPVYVDQEVGPVYSPFGDTN